jgi:hypothetical protein
VPPIRIAPNGHLASLSERSKDLAQLVTEQVPILDRVPVAQISCHQSHGGRQCYRKKRRRTAAFFEPNTVTALGSGPARTSEHQGRHGVH